VLDAGVILKRLLEDPTKEPDTEKTLALIDAVIHGRLEILQPVHWLIEVAAVAARLTGNTYRSRRDLTR
jgi:predicted nucleic acid-binding protein